MKILNLIASLILTALCFIGNDGPLVLAFAPWILPAALGALGGVANLFGDDEDYWTADSLKQKSGYKAPDYMKMKLNLARDLGGIRKERRANEQAKSMQYSGEAVAPSYQNEEDLSYALQRGYGNVDAMEEQETQRINDMVMRANINIGPDGSDNWFSEFLGGGLAGANIGLEMNNLLGAGGKDNPDDPDTKDKTNTDPNAPKNNPQTNFPDMKDVPKDWQGLFDSKPDGGIFPSGVDYSPKGPWNPYDYMFWLKGYNHNTRKK